jgi:hypothetical protein
MRDGYKRSDLGTGVRGKYFKEYQERSNVVVLDPDVAEVFHNAKQVNDALRELLGKHRRE